MTDLSATAALDPTDRAIVHATQAGLPLQLFPPNPTLPSARNLG